LSAKGRSFDTHSTTASTCFAARALNGRTEVAQVGVSTLGTMSSTSFLPA
jgi:hypothetical protein